ncbi:DUF1465 family protein [Oceanibaculum pacificum]|uniref:Regulator of CtrA degradation rcdA n=1 Tax=Oceanibaculum pacificum TaxID=580166 RepID=A0A154VQ28_9PROT|nr:DUF1465 family protein [Oceanibaculum pacificum]KZD03360.1 hypothetical protein AUP43_13205 [Oceanibaculum pacificum]
MAILPIDRAYSEIFALLIEARDCVIDMRRRRGAHYAGSVDARASYEALRVTSRLTHAMAWVMVQKAVGSGEMTVQEARDERHRLGGQQVCLHEPEEDLDLPPHLDSLLSRSLAIYRRIERLDRQHGGGQHGGVPASH